MKKTNTPTELWQVAQQWLLALGNKPNTTFCKEEIGTHPDYPALTALTDFLDAGKMKYVAAQADANYYNEFNYPLLAHIKQPGYEYLKPINTITDWDADAESNKNWSGIVLFAEKNTRWQNTQNNAYNKTDTINKWRIALFSTLALTLFVWLSMQHFNVTNFGFGLLSLAGLVISLFAFGVELGYQNQLVKQVCGAVSSGGCDTVLKSKFAKGIFGITPADASLVYFAAQFSLYLASTYVTNYFNAIAQISLLGIAIAGWSIYTQAVKVKQWCALCLGIVAVLLIQIAIAVNVIGATLYTREYTLFLAAIALLYTLLYPLKQLLKTNTTNQQKLAELKKWKTDATLFKALWQQELVVDSTTWENDLVIGKANAPLLLTVACNPYCGPCATAHKQLDELLEKHPNKLKVQIRLLCNPTNTEDKRTKAAICILQQAATLKKSGAVKQMLSDWFEWMDLEKWEQKWKTNKDIIVNENLEQHNNWINNSNVQFTPTFFLDGKKIPSKYNLSDLELLMLDL